MTKGGDSSADNRETLAAWNDLYSATDAFVWGEQPAPFLVELLDELCADLSPESCVLDAGTGEGRHLPLLLATGARVYACDASENALRKLPATLRDSTHTLQCELSWVPFDEGRFDLILLNDVFETLPDPGLVLKEMHRVLSAAGRLFCNVPDYDDGVANLDMRPLPDGGYLYRNRYYYRFWRPDAAIAIFQEYGFEIVVNRMYTWREGAHPEFRSEEHDHSSRILVAQRAAKRS